MNKTSFIIKLLKVHLIDNTGQQRKKNARAKVTYFVPTNSTVYVSGLRFSWI